MSKEKELWMNNSSVPDEKDLFKFGPYFSVFMESDPKHLVFTVSRYKFAMKMLKQNSAVLELGCSDGIGALILKERAKSILGVDFDHRTVNWAKENLANDYINFVQADILAKPFGKFDSIVSLDVIEHIYPENEHVFMEALINNLDENGVCIIGTPNITAEKYASKNEQHVNLFTAERLESLFSKYFNNVFSFGMNDEVLHTGYSPMCHYLFVVVCNPINKNHK